MSGRLPAILMASVALGTALAMGTAGADPLIPVATPTAGNYLVNAGDVLEISVWRELELQRQAVVRPDGYFSFPLTGDIRAEGQTIEWIRQEVSTRISRYIPDPVVSISVLEARGSKVYVIGQVNRPGEFPVNRVVDVVQAISMAGGTTPFAQVDNIKILRREGDTQLAIPFAYGDISAGKRLQQNILLRPGDTVLVP